MKTESDPTMSKIHGKPPGLKIAQGPVDLSKAPVIGKCEYAT